jgi:hypothetical protein
MYMVFDPIPASLNRRDMQQGNSNNSIELQIMDQASQKSFSPYASICNEWWIFGQKFTSCIKRCEDS